MAKKNRGRSIPKLERMKNLMRELAEGLEKDAWIKLGIVSLIKQNGLRHPWLTQSLINVGFIEKQGYLYKLGSKPISDELALKVIEEQRLSVNKYSRTRKNGQPGVYQDTQVIDLRDLEVPANPLMKKIIEERNISARNLHKQITHSDKFKELANLDEMIRNGF